MKVTVTYKDGETNEYDIPTYPNGGWRIGLATDEITEDIQEAASSGVLPESIVDENGKHYYVEWSANIIPCN